jgi:ATP:cob(I)alamin adenosyltransferase
MSIYTKTGDKGYTNLMKIQNVSKSDDRIQLLGNIDELTSSIGLVKAWDNREKIKFQLERIQKNLMTVMASIADPGNKTFILNEEETTYLEEEINRLEDSFPRKKEFVLPGSNSISAQLDVCRTVTRRAERWLIQVDKRFGVDKWSKIYMNRLADYLYMLARYTDYMLEEGINGNVKVQNNITSMNAFPIINQDRVINEKLTDDNMTNINEKIIAAVLEKLGVGVNKVDLSISKQLIEKLEEEAVKLGLNAVIAVCGPDGNPIAVHVMDNAYLASFDIAMKKAYTSVAVKMSTKRLGELAMPGETFYGIDKADNGRMIIIGGGVPLMLGDKVIGGLGISGGTSQEDSLIADMGLEILKKIFEKRTPSS